MHTDHTYTAALTAKKSCKESVISSLFNRACSIITNKDDLIKENPRIKASVKRKWIARKYY